MDVLQLCCIVLASIIVVVFLQVRGLLYVLLGSKCIWSLA